MSALKGVGMDQVNCLECIRETIRRGVDSMYRKAAKRLKELGFDE